MRLARRDTGLSGSAAKKGTTAFFRKKRRLSPFRAADVRAALMLGLLGGSAGMTALTPVHLRVAGTHFVGQDGAPFEWRGITAFRLVEFVAHGRAADADAYLAWAASKDLTVVRVLAMADALFTLSPADGQRALPELLDLAAKHNLHVEVVALADTARVSVDMPRHVKAIGRICAEHPNCLLEIANEPGHATQVRDLHDPRYVQSLAALVPKGVPIALGSVEYGEGYAAAAYVTWHPRRVHPVAALDRGADLRARYGKPVIVDEPIGAGDKRIPGRRANDPAVFRAMAEKISRLGLGATFHYEGGLQAKVPTAAEMACLNAWMHALRASSAAR